MEHKEYQVVWKRKIDKQIKKLPTDVKNRFLILVKDLRKKGAILPEWDRYSKLSKDFYHCHLGYSWCAVWQWEKGAIVVEVTYVGSRENSPY